eukprot:3102023-Pleurochrysis_carterae.AAC.1
MAEHGKPRLSLASTSPTSASSRLHLGFISASSRLNLGSTSAPPRAPISHSRTEMMCRLERSSIQRVSVSSRPLHPSAAIRSRSS